MRVVVTRPHADALRTAERLAELGHEPALSPVLSVRATGAALPEGPFDAVLATSANAFVGLDRGASAMSLPIFTVGESTAAAARRAGFDEIRQGPGRAHELAAYVVRSMPAGAKLLYLAGRDRTDVIENTLSGSGFAVTPVEIYAADPALKLSRQAEEAIRSGETVVLHYSARSAALFLALAIRSDLENAVLRCTHLCLSEAVAAPLREAGARTLIAARPDEKALIALLTPQS
jgi:uroporphyrinogen-III synthase